MRVRGIPQFGLVLSGALALLPLVDASTVLASEYSGSFGRSHRSRSFGYSGYSGYGTDEQTYSLSVAGAVASPSSTAFFGENPAGLIYTQSGVAQGYLATSKDHPELLSNGLSFIAGNGWASAMIGAQSFANATDAGGSITNFNFGAAMYSDLINFAMGLNGSYRFEKHENAIDPSLAPTWSADLGLLFNPYGTIRAGLTLYELSKGVTGFGFGLSTHVNNYSILAIDLSTDNHGRGLTIKPGLGVRAGSLNLTYAYGMQVDKTAVAGITVGNTLGLGYEFSPTFKLIGYYNHFATYFLAAEINLF